MKQFEFAKEVEDEARKVVTMTEIDNWSHSRYLRELRLKSFREKMEEYREDPMRLVELKHAEAFRRRGVWKRKTEEKLAAKEVQRIKKEEAAEVAELIKIFKKHIDDDDDDEDEYAVFGLDLHSMPTQKLTKQTILEEEATEVAELMNIFQKHIDEDEDEDTVFGLDLHSMPTQKLTKQTILEEEATEVAELMNIFQKHIDEDEDEDTVFGLDLHSMPTQKLTKQTILEEEATEVAELMNIFQKHIDEDEDEDTVFGLDLHSMPTQKLAKPAILPPTNRLSSTLEPNRDIISKISGKLRHYYSADSIASEDPWDAINYQPEFLYSLTPSGMPPHVLELNPGDIVMLLCNLNPKDGLCNGTRLVIKSLHNNLISAEIVSECNFGDVVFIPRIDFRSDEGLPFVLKRRQFPIIPAYAIKTEY